MKGLIRSVLVFSLGIWIIATYVGGISFGNEPKILFLSALAIALGNIIVVPLINLLLLPINILTLGSFRWISAVLLLVIVSLIIPGFSVHAFQLHSLATPFFTLPALSINLFFAYILTAFLLNVFANFFFWLAE